MMRGESIMGFINDLVRHVREHHNLTQSVIGLEADLSESHICRTELGEREVLARHLRAVFRLTGDQRILQYIWPGVTIENRAPSVAPSACDGGGSDPLESNEKLLLAIEKLAAAARYNVKTLADGKVDEHDFDMIHREQRHLNEVAAIIAEHQVNLAAWVEKHERGAKRK